MSKTEIKPSAKTRKAPVRPRKAAAAAFPRKIAAVIGADEKRGPGLHVLGTLFECAENEVVRVPRTLLHASRNIIDDVDCAHYVTVDKSNIKCGADGKNPWIEKGFVRNNFTPLERERKSMLEQRVDYSPDVDVHYDSRRARFPNLSNG